MAYANVALIAPGLGLENVEAEVRAVSTALHPVSLRNGVSVRDVTDLLTRQSWDIVWFACHGGRDGVMLSGEQMLDTSTLIQLVRNSGAQLVVFNTCESEPVGLFVHYSADVSVISTIAAVGDQTAYVTGALLARNLAAGLDIRTAYARSKPGEVALAQVYRLFDRDYSPSDQTAQLLELMTLVMQPIQRQLDALDDRLDRMENKPVKVDAIRRWSWVLGFVFFVAALPLYLLEVRDIAGISAPAALGSSMVLWAVSLLFFLYGLNFVGVHRG
jgi:hypothetical protein